MLGLDRESARQFGLFGIIVSEVAGLSLGFAGLGYWGHENWGWPLWLSALSAVLGLAIAIFRVYLLVKRDFRK